MKCPHCNTEINTATWVGVCAGQVSLKDKKITSYDDLTIMETQSIFCPSCNGNLTEIVEEL